VRLPIGWPAPNRSTFKTTVGPRYPTDVSLQKWKKNNVFEAVQKAGHRPEEFDWDAEGDHDRLTHLASRAYFVFGGDAGTYRLRYRSGDGPVEEREKSSWQGVVTSVELWLWGVKSDVEMPDLWGDLSHQREMLGPALGETVENTPFTEAERADIRKQLREVQEHVTKSYALSADELVVLNEGVAYSEEVAARLGRIDWRNAVAGAMVATLVAAALPPEAVRAFLEMLFQGVGQLFGHGLLPG
jgi:hypothetical protein